MWNHMRMLEPYEECPSLVAKLGQRTWAETHCGDVLSPVRWPPEAESLVPPKVLMVCGYKLSGKSTLAKELSECRFEHSWDVYTRGPVAHVNILVFEYAKPIAFGDPLRESVLNALAKEGLLPADFDYDKMKNVPLADGKSVRDRMKEVGCMGRMIDDAHWAKRALVPHFVPRGHPQEYLICGDWRYRSERDSSVGAGVSVTTARLFRADVPVPPMTDGTEHDLDACETDMLLVPGARDFVTCCEHMSQYLFYDRVCTIRKTF